MMFCYAHIIIACFSGVRVVINNLAMIGYGYLYL